MFDSDKCECAAACYHECVCDWVVKKQWQGLSDEERNKIWSNIEAEENTEMYFGGKLALAIEAKLKEKNNE